MYNRELDDIERFNELYELYKKGNVKDILDLKYDDIVLFLSYLNDFELL